MRLVRPLCLVAGLVCALAGLVAPASAFSSANGVRLNSVEARLAYLINQARTGHGVPALVVAPGTTDLARDWSMSQATRDTLQHNPSLQYGIEHHGSAAWGFAGENVGRGATADSLFQAYMNSPGHRANILDPHYRFLGIGWVERPDGVGYNTQVFVNAYSSTYGHSRVPALGGLADTRTVTSALTVASFESGWDPRVLLSRSGSGIATTGPQFDTPASGDQSVRFTVKESLVALGGGAELRVRDALDLRNATGLRVRLGAKSATGRAVTLTVSLRRELGTNVVIGTVTVPSGGWRTVTLPVPAGARNFRNAVSVTVTRSALEAVSSSLSARSVIVRVADVTVFA